jgi:hypothetical protein
VSRCSLLDFRIDEGSSSRPTTVFASRLLYLIRHAILTLPPSRGPWSAYIRVVPSIALSSTASDIHHARPSCTQFGRGLSSPNENTATRCTPPPCTSSLGMSLPCTVTPSPSSVAGSALTPVLPRHFRARPNRVRAVVARLHRRSRGSKPRMSPSFDPGCPKRFAQKPFTAASCTACVPQLLLRSPFQCLLTPPARRPFTPLAPRMSRHASSLPHARLLHASRAARPRSCRLGPCCPALRRPSHIRSAPPATQRSRYAAATRATPALRPRARLLAPRALRCCRPLALTSAACCSRSVHLRDLCFGPAAPCACTCRGPPNACRAAAARLEPPAPAATCAPCQRASPRAARAARCRTRSRLCPAHGPSRVALTRLLLGPPTAQRLRSSALGPSRRSSRGRPLEPRALAHVCAEPRRRPRSAPRWLARSRRTWAAARLPVLDWLGKG